jgi:hypothetical protein
MRGKTIAGSIAAILVGVALTSASVSKLDDLGSSGSNPIRGLYDAGVATGIIFVTGTSVYATRRFDEDSGIDNRIGY